MEVAGARVERNVEFGRAEGRALLLDLYLPPGATNGGAVPVIVWIHGGGWQKGAKENVGPAAGFAARGFAVASVGYRLSGEAVFPAQIEDCKNAVRWLRANAARYGMDGRRVAAWGSSAGGHLAALLGTSGGVAALETGGEPVRVQAVVDYYGPADFRPQTLSGRAGDSGGPVARLLGGPVADRTEQAALASPLTHISGDDPQFFIVHGDQDRVVPLIQSTRLMEALSAAGVRAELRVLPGAGHGGPAFSEPRLLDEIEAFLREAMAGAE